MATLLTREVVNIALAPQAKHLKELTFKVAGLPSCSSSYSGKRLAYPKHLKANRTRTSIKSIRSVLAPPGKGVDEGADQSGGSFSEDSPGGDRSHETDVIIIGAGIGGLCAGALLAHYGYKVTVCESHAIPGGAAHSFVRNGYHFDSGPSFHAGLSMKKSLNPLKQVLDVIGEEVKCKVYDTWIGYLPEGKFTFAADGGRYAAEIARVAGPDALAEWQDLERQLAPLAAAASALPSSALRGDAGVAFSAARFLPKFLSSLTSAPQLLKPFSETVDKCVRNPFLRNLIDLECFVLSGLLADSTMTAEMAFMFFERHRPEGTIDYPLGGGGAIIDALVRGLEKKGGRLMLNAHVQEVVVHRGRAAGVRLKPRGTKGRGALIRAKKAVVSNASVWDTQKLLPAGALPADVAAQALATPMTPSFLHLHLGIDAEGLPKDLECHHLAVEDWSHGIRAPQNVNIVSIPTVFDPALAPSGKHVVHAYTAGNEPYEIWEGLDRQSPEYASLKEERAEVLWRTLEKVIPDIRERTELKMIGTPLTHERYLRRSRGTYGAANRAGKESWPGPTTALPGLLCCGDSTMPGIGVPAVAASGMMAANTLVPIWQHWKLLDRIEEASRS